MKKRILTLAALLLSLLLLFVACAPAYESDSRIGSYIAYGADGKTVVYRLALEEDGKGSITYYPSFGGETREDVFFEIRDGVINVHGTEVVGGVIGRSELSGEIAPIGDSYSFELRSSDGVLANFIKE